MLGTGKNSYISDSFWSQKSYKLNIRKIHPYSSTLRHSWLLQAYLDRVLTMKKLGYNWCVRISFFAIISKEKYFLSKIKSIAMLQDE